MVPNAPSLPHPDSEELAAYLSGSLTHGERDALEAHFSLCRACRTEMVGAQRLLGMRRARRRWKIIVPAGAAAALGALVLLGPARENEPRGDRLREVPFTQPTINVIVPSEGKPADPTKLLFAWRPHGSAPFYRLTVTDVSGREVWVGETSDTTLLLPTEAPVERGREYLWYVDALDVDGRSATSGIHRLRTSR